MGGVARFAAGKSPAKFFGPLLRRDSPAGAGFGSNDTRWLTPPTVKRKITLFAFGAESGSLSPAMSLCCPSIEPTASPL